jgi:hypothetical protein
VKEGKVEERVKMKEMGLACYCHRFVRKKGGRDVMRWEGRRF